MESLNVNGKKKLTMINLSIFTNLADSFAALSYSSTSPSPNKSPRNFQNTSSSVVGLSIVAAMSRLTDSSSSSNHENYYSISRPVHIVTSPSAANYNYKNQKKKKKPAAGVVDITDHDDEHQADVDDEELSESYTCVISHLGNDLVHKRVFFDDHHADDHDDDHDDDDEIGKFSVFFASSSPPMNVGFGFKRELWSRDYFLSSCFLCNKNLHGLDIFMYRGEKAFCSTECRDKQIRSDDVKDNCGSEARKQLDYSVSPCSGPPPPPPISAGVAVA